MKLKYRTADQKQGLRIMRKYEKIGCKRDAPNVFQNYLKIEILALSGLIFEFPAGFFDGSDS